LDINLSFPILVNDKVKHYRQIKFVLMQDILNCVYKTALDNKALNGYSRSSLLCVVVKWAKFKNQLSFWNNLVKQLVAAV